MSYNPFSNGQYNTPAPTLTNGQVAPLQLDTNGNLKVTSGSGIFGMNLEQIEGQNLALPTNYGTAPSAVSPTPTFIQATSVVSSSSGTAVAVFGANVTVGDTLLASIIWDGNDANTLPTVTDTQNNSYTLVKSFLNTVPPGPSLTSIGIYAATASATGACTVTGHFTERGGMVVAEYANVTAVLDQFATAQSASSGSLSAGPVTTTQATELLFCAVGSIGVTGTAVAGAGFTIRAQGTISSTAGLVAIEDEAVSSTGSYSGAVSGLPASNFNSLLFVTLKGVVPSTTVGATNAFITNTVSTQDAADGPVTAGTAAGKSLLTGGVFNTSAPTLTNGQQAASQFDASGNLRVNPTGSVGSFATTKVSAAGNGGTVQLIITVPANTKWQLQAFCVLVQAANAGTPRVVTANVADASANFPFSGAAGVNAPINANTFFAFGPGLPLSTAITATNASVPCPAIPMGPSFSINVFIQNTNASDTLSVTASYISYPN